jgi:hypothetical protein
MKLKGFMLGMAAGALAGHAVVLWRLWRHGITVLEQDLRYSLSLLALGVVGALGPKYLALRLPHLPGKELLLTVGFAVVMVGTVGLWTALRLKNELFERKERPRAASGIDDGVIEAQAAAGA